LRGGRGPTVHGTCEEKRRGDHMVLQWMRSSRGVGGGGGRRFKEEKRKKRGTPGGKGEMVPFYDGKEDITLSEGRVYKRRGRFCLAGKRKGEFPPRKGGSGWEYGVSKEKEREKCLRRTIRKKGYSAEGRKEEGHKT